MRIQGKSGLRILPHGKGQRSAPVPTGVEFLPGERNGQGLRIGIFWSYLCGGGVETVNRDIADGLSRDKYTVDAIVWQALPEFRDMARSFDELVILNEPFEDFSPQEGWGPFTPVEQLASFQRLLLSRQYDALIMSCCWGPFWLARMHGIPVVEYWHGYGCWNGWDMPASAIVSVSDTTRKQIETLRPNHAPVTIIRNAIDFNRYKDSAKKRAAARSRFGIPPEAPVMLYCGRFSAEKRPEDAMKAFVKARESRPDLQLLLIGTCTAPEYFVNLARQIGCRWDPAIDGGLDTRHYTLSHDEVDLAYAAADVMVHPSDWEGLGMVLLEAMAVGVPIVSTFAGGCREVLQDIGVEVQIGDTDAMAAAVLDLLRNKRRTGQLIKKGRKRIEREFSLRSNADKLDAVLDSVIRPRSRPLSPEEVRAQEMAARRFASEVPYHIPEEQA